MFPGTQLGRYKIVEHVAAGGVGEVYLAHDPHLNRRVAIKVLPARLAADSVARERLRREALAAAALDHPFICKIFEVAEDGGAIFLVMEYVRGETLRARMRSGPLSSPDGLRIAAEIAEAIEEAHANGFVHRDLKRPTSC
jgi:eukaryotic-like serine/threonine-protein kinase